MLLKGAEPFFLPGSRQDGILLIHGFTGSPSEMLLLGEFLYKQGYTVLCPRLIGHGTTVEELAITSQEQWLNSVCDGYYLLKGYCKRITVIGLSMGGLLALKLSRICPVEKIVTLSTPMKISHERKLHLLPTKEKSAGRFKRKNRRDLPALAERYGISYDKMPLVGIHELLDLIEYTKTILPRITTPVLVVQGEQDHTVDPASGKYIYDNIGSEDKRLVKLNLSGHIVTLDIEHDKLFEEISKFL